MPAPAQGDRSDFHCRVLISEQGEGLWGAQRYLLRLAPLLEQRGIEQVLLSQPDSAITAEWQASGRRVVPIDAPATRSVRSASGKLAPLKAAREAGRILALARRTAAAARRVDADVIHSNSHWAHIEVVLAAKLAGRKSLLHLHEEASRDLLGQLRNRAVLAADGTIAVSSDVRDSLSIEAAAATEVIANGVNAEQLAPGLADPAVRAELTQDPQGSIVVLSMSRLDPTKGVDHIIRAIAQLPDEHSHVVLAIAGKPAVAPEHAQYLHRLAAQLLPDRHVFLGHRDDVPDLMRASDLMVLASSLEGMPLGILEAQSCGLPVVAFPAAGVRDLIDHGRTGMIAAAQDDHDLMRKIAELAGNSELRKQIAESARSNVLDKHTLEVQADQQIEVLRRVTTKRAA